MLGINLKLEISFDPQAQGCLSVIADSLAGIDESLKEIAFWARPHFAVGPVSVCTKWERPMSQFAYTFNLPVPAAPDDVAGRVVSIATNGATAVETPVDKTLTVSPEFTFDDGATFTVQVIDADAAGNKAAGPMLTVTVVDDVPPATPGELAVASKRQLP